jgi:hypothetical protein
VVRHRTRRSAAVAMSGRVGGASTCPSEPLLSDVETRYESNVRIE